VHSGPQTQRIAINCTFGTGNECNGLVVHAQTAQYLEVVVGAESELDGNAVVNCPQNSSYQGPEIAPCIIDASDGGMITAITINTLDGIPNDVWIKTGAIPLTRVSITCSAGSGGFDEQNICWHSSTDAPTTSVPATTTATTTTTTTTATTATTTTVSNPANHTSTAIATSSHDDISTTRLREGGVVDLETTTQNFDISKQNNSAASSNTEPAVFWICMALVLFICLLSIFMLRYFKKRARSALTVKARTEMEIEGQMQAEQITKDLRISKISLYSAESVQNDFDDATLNKFSNALRMEVMPTGTPIVLSVPTDEGYHDEELHSFHDDIDDIENAEHSEELPGVIRMHTRETTKGGEDELEASSDHEVQRDDASENMHGRDDQHLKRPVISLFDESSKHSTPRPPPRRKKQKHADSAVSVGDMETPEGSPDPSVAAEQDGYNDEDIVDVIDHIDGDTAGK